MWWQSCSWTLILSTIISTSKGENILFLIGIGSFSHRVAMQPLASKLAERGHNVTFLSPRKPEKEDPNIHDVILEAPYQKIIKGLPYFINQAVKVRQNNRRYDSQLLGTNYWDTMLIQDEAFLTDEDFIKLVRTSQYDLILADFPIIYTGHVVAHVMKSKIIWYNTGSKQSVPELELLGIPIESSWLPDMRCGSPYDWLPEHFYYAFNSLHWHYSFYTYYLPKLNNLVEQGLGEGIPSVDELIPNVDLVLNNEHFTYGDPRSLPPYMVSVGGMHVKESNGTLPKDLADFVQSDDFVFISFGSLVDVNKLPQQLQKVLFDTVASFENVKFLWKWDGNIPDNLPKNVLAMKWFPQQDLLANPQCRGFVTQGGAMSYQQAVYNGVPMIVVPVWWDQPCLARSAVQHGIGIHLELSEITRESFQSALQEIIYDKKYAQKAKIIAQRAKDQPMPPVDLATYWVEYILRHDTQHLKSPAMKQRWWQRRLLDVWSVLYSVLLAITILIWKFLKMLLEILLLWKQSKSVVLLNNKKAKRS